MKLLIALADSIPQVLVDVLAQEWRDARHQSGGAQEDVKEYVQAELLLLASFFAFHSWAVEAHVPIRQLVEEVEQRWNNLVKLAALHLLPHELDQVLARRNDPPIHEVAPLAQVAFES